MTSLADNAIALLLDMAERGELDPWNVQVIEVIDRFLSQLQPSATGGRAAYEADLSQSGQAFLYASMLVLLKADSLARAAEAAEAPPEEEEFLELTNDSPLPLRLERSLRRRAVARPPQSRRVTLAELIAQLEVMATTLAEQTPRVRARRPKPHSRAEAVASIADLAHAENLSEVAAAIERFLRDHWSEINQGQDWMDFEALLAAWAQPGVNPIPSHSPQGDRVAVFWGLLFLSAQSKVELAQTEFYQDLQVRSLCAPGTVSCSAEGTVASADLADLSLALLD
ncbi:segregation/condensation protein A [Microcoleus sp. FACHB-1515]|uniref:segregation/condensation protein A n=1 Tax=Cyanophyceae TaxID=3028117 RepID=UPI001689B8EC|nr:segregation/condensation protein A [Microcoleus sp. FACHB-1515]MBD2089089.1 segregation/condensation protein A [Microcoleus sp. FACHB-1515]